MPNQLDITSGQTQATQRHDLYGVVYLLSGMLQGRAAGIPDTAFYWGTHNVNAPLGAAGADIRFDAFLSPPTGIRRAMSFDPRTGPSTPAIRVPVYNLAFAHADTLLAGITDNDWSWENTRATLRVGYLKPGQSADGLAAEDWTPLVLDGFFGAPQDIQLDGFNLVLYNRGANRNQSITQRVIDAPAFKMDKSDVGRPYPIVVGRPDSWFRPPTLNIGVRGYTVSGYNAGDKVIVIAPLTSGIDMLKSSGGSNDTEVMIHYRKPVLALTTDFADVVYDADNNLLTFELAGAGLTADIPRGAYVQEKNAGGYLWALADYGLLTTGADVDGFVGFRFADGRIVAADLVRWPFSVFTSGGGLDTITSLGLLEGSTADPNVPVFFEPASAEEVAVTQQPTFTSTLNLTGKLNYGTGGAGGTNNSWARDGNDFTAMTLAISEVATITFNSAPSPFVDDDTTASIIHLVKGAGVLTLTNSIGSVTFANVPTQAGTYRFVQSSARDFNETIRIVAGGTGGSVAEIWWEHDATTQDTATRTDDVAVDIGVGGAVGEVMRFADVVFRMPKDVEGNQLLEKALDASGSLVANPWLETETTGFPLFVNQPISYPAAALAGLQWLLLGAEGGLDSIAQDTYDAAHVKHKEEGIRWNFVLLEPINSWTDLEQALAGQSRTNMFYGPSGHEMVFQEAVSGYDAAAIRQDFRLESVPGANAPETNGPLIERTPVSEIRNRVVVDYAPDYVNSMEPQASQEQSAADSVALFGERTDPRGRFNFWAHSPDTGNPNYSADASVSGIAAYMADRYAFAQTRFRFRTAWIAHGLDRGSVVRVAYRIGEDLYRNVRCEVEDIKVAPTDTEQMDLVCRTVSVPKRGYAPAFTWDDVFSLTDTWATQITGTIDRWEQFWDQE